MVKKVSKREKKSLAEIARLINLTPSQYLLSFYHLKYRGTY